MKLATVAFYALALGLLAVGLRELLTGSEENRCSMTYMFEYPEYRVSDPANYSTSHTTAYVLRCSLCCIVYRIHRYDWNQTYFVPNMDQHLRKCANV